MDTLQIDSDPMVTLNPPETALPPPPGLAEDLPEVIGTQLAVAANDSDGGGWSRAHPESGSESTRLGSAPSVRVAGDGAVAIDSAAVILTPRQVQILHMIVRGCSNKEIASRVFVSENTVKFHLKNLYSRLGVRCRVEAAFAASQRGLVRFELSSEA